MRTGQQPIRVLFTLQRGVSPGERRQLIIMRQSDQWARVFTLPEWRFSIGTGQEKESVFGDSIRDFSCFNRMRGTMD
ncbi:hypothetical protein F2P79_022608 [Pimephales promelas]|nr:hypothetical protein F2P79_022608 [Pimephales promelas]